jgi:uncharacterized protein (TIGR02466 family)
MAKTTKSTKKSTKPVEATPNVITIDTGTPVCPVDIPKKQEELQQHFHFPTVIYTIMKPEFLKVVNEVSDENLKQVKKDHGLNEIYPVYMSGNFYDDPRVAEFSQYIGGTAWNILAGQGYAMENMVVQFTEMWTQEHYKHSLMEQHAHGYGSQLVGFYFLETPEDCSRAIFHDPRPSKTIVNLPESNMGQASYGSNMINFEPKPGMLMFANSWLPHSFGRHGSDKPIKFVHFNITVNQAPQDQQIRTLSPAEASQLAPARKPAEVI